MSFHYPYNLLLVSLAAGLSFYLGFLPLQTTPRKLFVYVSFLTIILWAVAGLISARMGLYILGCGLMATAAWRQFCLERHFPAKMWLSAAAALGGTFCLLLLTVIPKGPAGSAIWFFTSVYFGAFVLTTACMIAALVILAKSGEAIPKTFLDNALLFGFLAIGLRFVLAMTMLVSLPKMFPGWGNEIMDFWVKQNSRQVIGWMILGIGLPLALNLWSWTRLKQGRTPASLWQPLTLSFFSVLAGEFLARRLFL